MRGDGVGDAEHVLDPVDLRDLIGHARDLRDRRGCEDVPRPDADHRHVVAPEDGAGLGVVLDLGVARRQHALERALDAELERVEAQHRGHEQVREHDGERVTGEPPREGVHEKRAIIAPARPQASGSLRHARLHPPRGRQ